MAKIKFIHVIIAAAGIFLVIEYVLPAVFPKLAAKKDELATSVFLAGVL